MAKNNLGQNFLINPSVADRIAEAFIGLHQSSRPVIEIGPGKGILTRRILPLLPPPLFLVELDRDLIPCLQEEFSPAATVVHRDILKIDPAILKAPPPFDLIGNIPYNISSPLTDWINENASRIHSGILMTQREFGQKLCLKAGLYPRFLLFQRIFQTRILFQVSPGSFCPSPRVRSAVLSFSRRNLLFHWPRLQTYRHFLNRCFAQRRKTLLNNLQSHYDKRRILRFLKEWGYDPRQRADSMAPESFPCLFTMLTDISPAVAATTPRESG